MAGPVAQQHNSWFPTTHDLQLATPDSIACQNELTKQIETMSHLHCAYRATPPQRRWGAEYCAKQTGIEWAGPHNVQEHRKPMTGKETGRCCCHLSSWRRANGCDDQYQPVKTMAAGQTQIAIVKDSWYRENHLARDVCRRDIKGQPCEHGVLDRHGPLPPQQVLFPSAGVHHGRLLLVASRKPSRHLQLTQPPLVKLLKRWFRLLRPRCKALVFLDPLLHKMMTAPDPAASKLQRSRVHHVVVWPTPLGLLRKKLRALLTRT
mmetsp:Transcript_76489/g.175318  ORF Transcript_76489/g.175318 Transcript_76489/m.175318 type:complete len:263 (-) Transcript_76489:785-1573(-)